MPRNKPMQGGKKPVCRKLSDIDEKLKMTQTDREVYHVLELEESIL